MADYAELVGEVREDWANFLSDRLVFAFGGENSDWAGVIR